MIINTFLEFENNKPQVLDFKFSYDNVLMWPYIRYELYNYVRLKELNLENAHAPRGDFNFVDLSNYNINTLKLNAFDRDQEKYKIIMISDVRNNTMKKDGKYFNTVHDYFALEFKEDTLIIEKSYRKKYRLPRYFNNVRFEDSIDYLISSKIKSSKIKQIDKKEIERLITFVNDNFTFNLEEEYYKRLKKKLINLSKKLKYYHLFYKALFVSISPQIIFVKCASYGNRSYLIKWIKDMGIKVGEFQHGNISKEHIAYNYSNCILKNDEYKKYLPDYLLTYGQYWNENMTIPVQKVIIGNPHFHNKLKEYSRKEEAKKQKEKILIVSQGTLTNKLVNLTKELSVLIKDENYEIIYRLHPGEVPFKERYKELYKYNNITISDSGDIYDLIYKSDYIIGVYSTTVYEAIGFNKPIFIYEHEISKNISKKIGKRFTDAKELYFFIKEKKYKLIDDINYYWERDWKKNYRNFINKVLN